MLSYAFKALKQTNYEHIATEKFEHIHDLLAAILAKGVAQQLKQGLHKEYIPKNDELTVMRGKLDTQKSIKHRIQKKQLLSCEFDELSENNLFNQILKTSIEALLTRQEVSLKQKAALKKCAVFFSALDSIPSTAIPWGRLSFHRNNHNYVMLMNLCYFILTELLHTKEKGVYKMAHFSEENMAKLYEHFILEYYKAHHSYLSEIKAAQVKWDLRGDHDEAMIRFLPAMKTDIFLRQGDKTLIIDAKYYGQSLQTYRDKKSLHSNNMYQIFSYVKNKDTQNTGRVAGILLYAKTDEAITPDCTFNIAGNIIEARTLDLGCPFSEIRTQLDSIVHRYFKRA